MKLKAFHKLSYGLYIIASEFEGCKSGYIANTAFQVTSSPIQLAISCHKNNASADIILKSGAFSVSVLKKEIDTRIIGDFGFTSSSEKNKFSNVNTITAKSGAPIVTNESIAWIDCKVVSSNDLGTHYLIIGEVLDSEIISDEEPLTYDYYREKHKMFSPKNAPTYIDQEELAKESTPPTENTTNESKEHICVICGFKFDPVEGDPTVGIPPGTSFEDLPEDYKCPICSAGKDFFKEV